MTLIEYSALEAPIAEIPGDAIEGGSVYVRRRVAVSLLGWVVATL